MKTRINPLLCGLLIAAGSLFSPVVLQAQTEGKPPAPARPERPERPEGGAQAGGQGGGQWGARGGAGGGIEQLRERLALTDEQVEKLKPILAAQMEETRAARAAAGEEPDRTVMRAAQQAIREKYRSQIEAVLTPEQKAKWAEGRQGGGQRAGGPAAPGRPADATPPPPPPAPAPAE